MIRALVIACMTGCIGQHPAPVCRPGDLGCAQVRDTTESFRGRLDNRCGHNRILLGLRLRETRSPAIVHYLDDLDPHIARTAGLALRALGGDASIAELCASGYVVLNRDVICR